MNACLSARRKVKTHVQALLDKLGGPVNIAYAGLIIPWAGLSSLTREKFVPPPAPPISQAMTFSTHHSRIENSSVKTRHHDVRRFSISSHARNNVRARANKNPDLFKLPKLSVMQSPTVFMDKMLNHAVQAALGPYQNDAQVNCKGLLLVQASVEIETAKAAGLSAQEAAEQAFESLGGNNSHKQFACAHGMVSMRDTAACPKAERAGLTNELTRWVPFYHNVVVIKDPRFVEASELFSQRYGLFVTQNDVNFLTSWKYTASSNQ